MERRRRPHASPPRPLPPPRVALADPNSHCLSFSARSSRRRRRRRRCRSGEESELEPPRPRQGWGKRADLAGARAKRAGRSRARAHQRSALAGALRAAAVRVLTSRFPPAAFRPRGAQLPPVIGARSARSHPQPHYPAPAERRGSHRPNNGAGRGGRMDRWGVRHRLATRSRHAALCEIRRDVCGLQYPAVHL
ncbi:uncharacterized protein [Symphalangus syndactylus]|uniref:uncharacterized protein n=1 Tax=Symphalangus syndactylus TaxID=9590 RepID=UPI0030050139